MDSKPLIALKNCEVLSLSTNTIERMVSLSGMANLRILSLGRNNIKKLEKLEDIPPSLEQLWISYNQISSLDGFECLINLHTLYMSNNAIKSFSELSHLVRNYYYFLVGERPEAFMHYIPFLIMITIGWSQKTERRGICWQSHVRRSVR
jgi:Leucine-rich repeat (LRR) protein